MVWWGGKNPGLGVKNASPGQIAHVFLVYHFLISDMGVLMSLTCLGYVSAFTECLYVLHHSSVLPALQSCCRDQITCTEEV